jgi:GABA(A) receptor-associated protein
MSEPSISGYYKKNFPLHERIKKCDELRNKHPDRIPCICEKSKGARLNTLESYQLSIPEDADVNQLSFILRRHLNIDEISALFLIVEDSNQNKYSLTGNKTIKEIYSKYCDPEDKFLYITYASEDLWG